MTRYLVKTSLYIQGSKDIDKAKDMIYKRLKEAGFDISYGLEIEEAAV